MRVQAARWPRRALNTARPRRAGGRAVRFWPIERVESLPRRRRRNMVRHAFVTVPDDRETMDQRGLRPDDVAPAADLAPTRP